jgi:hypothetical protein
MFMILVISQILTSICLKFWSLISLFLLWIEHVEVRLAVITLVYLQDIYFRSLLFYRVSVTVSK